jgi:hypothetical protein
MDIEYHYYITGIIARRAGFSDDEAFKIAYCSQYTDDNNVTCEVYSPGGGVYESYISQTLNILKPKRELLRIHPCFHFFPGTEEEILRSSLPRKDGKLHLFNTVPDNSNAKGLMEAAFQSRDLYRIGIATHTYADTFAHQNFVGADEVFNAMKGVLEVLTPNVGHADARHAPDWPALVWKDDRIIAKSSRIDNRERFLEASGRIFTMYRLFLDPGCTKARLARDKSSMLKDLDAAIGGKDRKNEKRKTRVKRYRRLMGDGIGEYKKRSWFNKAVRKNYKDVLRGEYTYEWKQEDYEHSDWYNFQEAVKTHQKTAMAILKPLFERTELVETGIW